jgi:hypothetical protein
MTDYIVDFIKNDSSINQPDVRFDGEPEKLVFNIDEKIQKAIGIASTNVDKYS